MSERRVARQFEAKGSGGRAVTLVAERVEVDVIPGQWVRRSPWVFSTSEGEKVRAGAFGYYAIAKTGEQLRTFDPREPQADDCY